MAILPKPQGVLPSPGLTTRLINAGLGGISTAGKILDTPGALARGLIRTAQTGSSEDLANAISGIYDTSRRISGTELIGGEKDKFTWGGLGVEILTDPTTYLSFGTLTAAGQLSKRATVLGAKQTAQKLFAEAGSELAARRLAGTSEALAKIGQVEEYGKTIGEQFRKGQRSLVALDLPFPKIRADIIKAPEYISKLVDTLQNSSQTLADTSTMKALRKAFVATEQDPIKEALRQELRADYKAGLRAAAHVGEDIARQRILLSAKDPEFDLKVIKLLEDKEGVLDMSVGPPSVARMGEMLRARLRVEEMYGKIDNFENVWTFAQELKLLNEQILAAEKATGVPVDEFTDFGYVARILTSEGRDILKNSKKGRQLVRNYLEKINAGSTSAFQQTRKMRSLGIDDLNKALAKEHGKQKDFKFFDTDLASVQVNRMIGSTRQINRARFTQAVVDHFGKETLTEGAEDIPIEKLISPIGALVTNVRLKVPLSGIKYAKFINKRLGLIGGIEREGIKIGPYDFVNIDPEVLKEIDTLGLKGNFRKISGVHAAMDDRWLELEAGGFLQPEHTRMLRTFFSQIHEDHLPKAGAIRGLEGEELKRFRQTYGTDKTPSGLYWPSKDGGSAVTQLTKNSITGKPQHNAFHVFLHEFGHALHLSQWTDPDYATAINNLYDIHRFRWGPTNLGKMMDRSFIGASVARPTDAAKYYSRDAAEWFAENFARYMLGERTTNKALDRFLKKGADYFKDWRDIIINSDFFNANSTRYGGEVPPGAELKELYQEVLRPNIDIVKDLPGSSRLRLLTDLLEPVHTRKGFIDIPADATEGVIKKLFKENGVNVAGIAKEDADFFERMLKISQFHTDSDTLFGKFIRMMDEVHALYRTSLTQYFPAFHARNATSNVFMNMMAGVYNPGYYYKAMQMLRSMDPEDALYLSSLAVLDEGKTREVYDFLSQSKGGITSALKSAFVKPVTAVGGQAAGDVVVAAGQQANKWTRHVGYTIENVGRLAHYLAKKDAGLSDGEAADSVVKYFFDYSDLTDFERAVARRSMLFYTFFRKNMPLMLENVFTNPRFMLNYARATGQTNANIPRPEWLPDSFYLTDTEHGENILLNFGLPPEDLARFDPHGDGLARVFELAIASLVPTIKEPYQFISGRNAYLGRPMEGGVTERLAAALPTSRVTSTGERIAKAARGDAGTSLGGEVVRSFLGVGSRTIDPEVQKNISQLEATRGKLRELVRSGDARTIEIVGSRKGEDNPAVRSLNSQASKLEARLRKLDEKKIN